jgi:hypothetical protein
MAKSMILGQSHDTCAVCGKDIQMRTNRRLYHHGHPSRPCPGAGEYGIRLARFMAKYLPHNDGPGPISGDQDD